MAETHLRRVRSFVRRAGRVTESQRRALERLFPLWGVEYADARLDLDALFGRSARRVLDIGFGDGEALLTSAVNYRDVDFLGVEVHEPGVGHLLRLIEEAKLSNVRVVNRDIVDVLDKMLPPAAFDAVNIFFPDPWPKKRHHKRRLIQPGFVRDLAHVMKPGAWLHVATDWSNYAEQIEAVLEASADFERLPEQALADEPLASRAPTKFELRGLRLGHEVADFHYRRRG